MYWKMSWGWWTRFCIGLCIGFYFMLAGCAGVCFHFLSFMSFHFRPFHLLSPVMYLERWNGSKRISGKRNERKNHRRKMRQNQRKSHESMSGWITWLAVFHNYGHQYLIHQCSWCLLGIYRRKDSDHGTSQCMSRGMEILRQTTFRINIWLGISNKKRWIRSILWSFWGSNCSWLLEIIHVNQQQKSRLKWSIFWCFRRVVNKVYPCQISWKSSNSGRLSIESSRKKSVNMINLLVIQECSE